MKDARKARDLVISELTAFKGTLPQDSFQQKLSLVKKRHAKSRQNLQNAGKHTRTSETVPHDRPDYFVSKTQLAPRLSHSSLTMGRCARKR